VGKGFMLFIVAMGCYKQDLQQTATCSNPLMEPSKQTGKHLGRQAGRQACKQTSTPHLQEAPDGVI
jgi:hypothetical protein